MKDFNENPEMGDSLGKGFRKIRLAIASKNRGKSGGARIITFDLSIQNDKNVIILVQLYDKSNRSTINESEYEAIIKQFLRSNSL